MPPTVCGAPEFMSIRHKIIIYLCLIITIIVSFLSFNTMMARREGRYVKKLLWIHHQYTALLNLKIHVNRQLSEAQDIFIYGKRGDLHNFEKNNAAVKDEGIRLSKALMKEDALFARDKSDGSHSDNQRHLIELQHNYEDLQRQLVLMVRLLDIGRKTKAQEHFKNVISQRFNDFFTEIDNWIVEKRQELKDTEVCFVQVNERNNYYSVVALSVVLLIVIVFSGAVIYLLSRRMHELLKATKRIADGDLVSPVSERGNDEFSQFAKAMNVMMQGLAASRKRLLEQSYYSGMADMVAGALHNIRNVLVPVVVDLETIDHQLVNIRSDRIGQAIDEIRCQETSESRRQELLEFLTLSCAALDNTVLQLSDNVAGIGRKIGVITKILDDNSHYAVAERPVETVTVGEIIQDALGLMGKSCLDHISVVIAANIGGLKSFVTPRIVIVQIIVNLLNNAVESISCSGVDQGLLSINAKDEMTETGRRLHIEINDNGVGIAPDMLDKIFQRGVSTKSGSNGLGLHWCANAASSLNGNLSALSKGIGLGASLSLVLELPLE